MITDWNDAYANRDHIPDADAFIPRWNDAAQAFRTELFAQGRAEIDIAYGDAARNRMDIFHPEGTAKGLLVFIHGGYWRLFDKSTWSHFAKGVVDNGWSVAMPSYTLAPDISISGITQEIGAAVNMAAGKVSGDIRLAGHSAGGHLAARMICEDTPLEKSIVERIVQTVSISGVHDLRPVLRLQINDELKLDEAEASAESPALLRPIADARAAVFVGDDERPEFVRQSTLLANIWTGLGADMTQVIDPGTHHFTVIDGLTSADSPLTRLILS